MDDFMHYGVAAGIQAVADSGIDLSRSDADPLRRRHAARASAAWAPSRPSTSDYLKAHNPRKISPFFVPATIINMIAGHLSIKYGLRGPEPGRRDRLHDLDPCHRLWHAHHPVRRCRRDHRRRRRDGHHARAVWASFAQAKALSTRNDAPQEASRPWDQDRDGFVLSDGGGAVVLEELEHARARGAHIYAELVGFGMSGDAHHITAPPEDGDGARLAMTNALRDARHEPDRCAVHQRARHLDAAGRQGRDHRHEARLRRSRQASWR